jgi:hypothetical protein
MVVFEPKKNNPRREAPPEEKAFVPMTRLRAFLQIYNKRLQDVLKTLPVAIII